MAGSIRNYGPVREDIFFSRNFLPDGNVTQAVRWGGSGDDSANAIAVDAQGAVWLTGQMDIVGRGLSDIFIARVNSPGLIDNLLSTVTQETIDVPSVAIDLDVSPATYNVTHITDSNITDVISSISAPTITPTIYGYFFLPNPQQNLIPQHRLKELGFKI